MQAETVWKEFRTARQEVIRTSRDIGEGDPQQIYSGSPFAQAIKRVQVIDDEIKIFGQDALEVTGIFVKD